MKDFQQWYLKYRNYLMDAVLFVAILSAQPLLKRFLMKEVVNNDSNQYSSSLGWLYAITALSQGVGALLVSKQVQLQLQNGDRPSYKLFPLLFIIIMHFIIFGILFWIDGTKHINDGSIPFLAYLVMFFPTIAAILVIIPPGKIQAPLKTLELVSAFIGTLMLAFSALVVLTSFWSIFMDDIAKDLFSIYATSKKPGFQIFINKVLISLLFAALFILFYAPSRMVFLATDWYKCATWVTMFIVFVPFLIGLWTGE